jgi:hypothetical protein
MSSAGARTVDPSRNRNPTVARQIGAIGVRVIWRSREEAR